MAGSVVVLGEALVDLLTGPGDAVRAVPGGGPYNAARALARLGTDVVFVGRLSDDRFGRLLSSRLLADGVHLADLEPSARPTTLAVVELDDAGTATYSFRLTATSSSDLTRELALTVVPVDASVLHVGTLGLVLEPLASAVEALVSEAPEDRLVFCDPNVRPGAVHDWAGYRARLQRIFRRADIVKVSADDLRVLYPGHARSEAVAAIHAAGSAVVLVTDGGRDVHVVLDDDSRVVPVPEVEVVDTVGAGDAFGAGFLHSWLATGHGRDFGDHGALVAAATYGARVAALTCGRAGADPPTAGDVVRAYGDEG